MLYEGSSQPLALRVVRLVYDEIYMVVSDKEKPLRRLMEVQILYNPLCHLMNFLLELFPFNQKKKKTLYK